MALGDSLTDVELFLGGATSAGVSATEEREEGEPVVQLELNVSAVAALF